MLQPRLKSKLLIQACIRLCSERGLPATVIKTGDPDAGMIFVKVNAQGLGCMVLSQAYDVQEELYWTKATGENPVEEQEADQLINRQIGYDQDVWVLEIEDKLLRNPFERSH